MAPLRDKPFPWKCPTCQERTMVRMTIPYSVECAHDGRTYTVSIPDLAVPRCPKCGDMIFDSPATTRIDDAFREMIGLLSPAQIRHNREALGLTQEQLAASLGIAAATISRWESGHQIQQRAMDRLLRLYFAHANVRQSLGNEAALSELGATVNAEVTRIVAEFVIDQWFFDAAIRQTRTSEIASLPVKKTFGDSGTTTLLNNVVAIIGEELAGLPGAGDRLERARERILDSLSEVTNRLSCLPKD
jgi:putative zinc finger/helix-turn-helix YgiT family protein